MSISVRRRGAAATALALAGGTLLAAIATAGPAGASTLSGPAFFSAATEGDVVQVNVNLPAALPNLPQKIGLALISAKGNALHDAINGKADVSQSFARLAGGTLVEGKSAPLAMLDRSVSADLASPSASDELLSLPQNPIANGAAGTLKALVTKATVSNDSAANLTKVNVLKLSDILGSLGNVGAQINSALTDAINQVTPVTQNVIDTAVNNLNNVVSQTAGTSEATQVSSTVNSLTSTLQQLQQQLPSLLNTALDSPVVSLDALDANQAIDRSQAVTAQAHAKLLGLDILGGLVTVKGFVSDATATAGGVAGSAKSSYNPVIADASVGNGLLGVKLDAAGLGLTGSGLPADVQNQVNQILSTVQSALNDLLSTLGLKITPVAGSSTAAADGKSAAATGGSMLISLTPPSMTEPLVAVRLGGTTAKVNAAQATQTVVANRPPALPHTGANLPLAGGAGVVLLASAAFIRRRMTS